MYTPSSKIASCFFCEIKFSRSSFLLASKLTSLWAFLKKRAVQNSATKAIHSIANVVILSSTDDDTVASISDNRLRISRTTSKVIISNCFPIELVNDLGIVRINSYTS